MHRPIVLVVMLASCSREPRAPAPIARDVGLEQQRFDAQRRPDTIVAAAGIKAGAKVADVGAGTGLLTVHLADAVKPNGLVVATDIDMTVLDLLQERLEATGLDDLVDQRVVDPDVPGLETGTYDRVLQATDDPAPADPLSEAGTYDAIVLSEVDHLLTDEAAWLATAAVALSPHGRIVITNRLHHRDRTLAAARQAHLTVAAESAPVPTHFIAVLTR
ncbi:MAG: class I SAM-dependent methyltransferase [Kofleriaceae bacterium]